VALLDGGRLIAQGSPGDVLTPERLRAVYGVSVVVERLSQGQIVCAPDYGVPSHRSFAGRGPGGGAALNSRVVWGADLHPGPLPVKER
jgi:hypothetical protein